MNYKTKIWLSKQWWFRIFSKLMFLIGSYKYPWCGHFDTCLNNWGTVQLAVDDWAMRKRRYRVKDKCNRYSFIKGNIWKWNFYHG